MMGSLAERTGLSLEKLAEIRQKHQPAPAPENSEANQATSTTTAANEPEPNKPPPKTRQRINFNHSESTRNPVLYAIALLLHEPTAASHVEIPPALHHNEDTNAPLLLAILQLLHKRPDSTPAMLIGHWYNEPYGEILQQLLQLEQFIPQTDIDQELTETLNHLSKQHQQQTLGAQVESILSKDYAVLTDSEKDQLKELLKQKHDL
jgi:DNA primase